MGTGLRRIRGLVAAAVVAPAAVLAVAAGDNTPVLISVSTGSSPADGDCFETSVSNDGNVVAFRSVAGNLSAEIEVPFDHVYVRDRRAGVTTLVSVAYSKPFTLGAFNPKVSADGRTVVFQTPDAALQPPDDNTESDLYLLDRRKHELRIVSLNAGGEVGDHETFLDGASLSANGRYVVAYSSAGNLTEDALEGGAFQVFLFDFKRRTVTLVSKSPAGVPGDSSSTQASVSANGRWVAFQSSASNLAPGGGRAQIYRYDVKRKVLVHASPSSTGGAADGICGGPVVANTGAVAFTSDATNLLAAPDENGESDVFLFDPRQGVTVRRISETPAGLRPDGSADHCSISQSGTLVAFDSTQALDDADTGILREVYVRDLRASTLRIVSRNAAGLSADGDSTVCASSLSANGRWLAYTTRAYDIVDGDQVDGVANVVLVDPRK